MKILFRLAFVLMASSALGAVKSEPAIYDNVPTVSKTFSGNEPPMALIYTCEEWVKQTVDELSGKGMTILKSGCVQNPIIAPPHVVVYGKVNFIR